MLLNAYRAIFKSAYFKGMASAVILTAGLAAGAANAEELWSGGTWPAAGTEMQASGGEIKIEASLAASGGTVIFNNASGSLVVASSGSNAVNLSGDGSLIFQLASGDGGFKVSVADNSGAATVDLKNIEIQAGQIAEISNSSNQSTSGALVSADTFKITGEDAKLTISATASGSATLGQSGGVGANDAGDDITVSDGAKVILSSTASGAATIAGSTLTLDGGVIESSGSTSEKNQITTSHVVMKDGSVIKTDGSGSTLTINLASDTTTFSVAKENDELNQLFSMNGGYIKVASGDTLNVDGQTNFNQVGGTIELGGDLVISATSGNPSLTISTDDGLQAVHADAEVTVGSSGALTITSQALQNFLEDDDYSRDKTTLIDGENSGEVTDTTGHLKLSGGALNFSTDVDLNDFEFSGSTANGTIQIASASSINADGKKLTMADELVTAGSAKVTISATCLAP